MGPGSVTGTAQRTLALITTCEVLKHSILEDKCNNTTDFVIVF